MSLSSVPAKGSGEAEAGGPPRQRGRAEEGGRAAAPPTGTSATVPPTSVSWRPAATQQRWVGSYFMPGQLPPQQQAQQQGQEGGDEDEFGQEKAELQQIHAHSGDQEHQHQQEAPPSGGRVVSTHFQQYWGGPLTAVQPPPGSSSASLSHPHAHPQTTSHAPLSQPESQRHHPRPLGTSAMTAAAPHATHGEQPSRGGAGGQERARVGGPPEEGGAPSDIPDDLWGLLSDSLAFPQTGEQRNNGAAGGEGWG